MSLPHNPNRAPSPGAGEVARPYTVKHPLFTYTTVVPISEEIARKHPSPFTVESDFTASPPLFYAHAAPVEQCIDNHFTKYPHASVPEIIECPITEDTVDPATGVRTRVRDIKCTNIAPWIFRRFVGGDFIHLREVSTYDPRTRVFNMRSENQTYSNIVFAKEASTFEPHPLNPKWTNFVQYGGVRCSSYFGPLKPPLERFICDRMIRGGLQATDLLDDVLNSQSPFE